MRLDVIRETELQKRKGFALRTVLAVSWLLAAILISFFLSGWLFSSGTLGAEFFYNDLKLSPVVNENVIRLIMMLVLVIILQFILVIGFALTSPDARKRTGQASAEAQDPDPFDTKFNYN